MRAFLLASATTAFCQPTRSLQLHQPAADAVAALAGAVITADFAPWISSVRR